MNELVDKKLADELEAQKKEMNELVKRVILDGASTKGICSATHIHTQNEMTVRFDDSLRKLTCFIMDLKELIPLQLEHDREIEVLSIDPKDIRFFWGEMSGWTYGYYSCMHISTISNKCQF